MISEPLHGTDSDFYGIMGKSTINCEGEFITLAIYESEVIVQCLCNVPERDLKAVKLPYALNQLRLK